MTAHYDTLKTQPRCLVVLLPGAADYGDAYIDEGFVKMIRDRNLSADVIAPDATIRYYLDGTVTTRLHDDLIGPAKQRGYERTWLIGISMGGFGSLFYPSQRAGEVDGVLALAPYLGDEPMIRAIADAGGLAKWTPPAEAPTTKDNYQAQFWRWLRETQVEGKPGPTVWLGWGTEDGLGRADGLLAQVLPKERLLSAPGKHDWPPWKQMFADFLARSPLATDCAPR